MQMQLGYGWHPMEANLKMRLPLASCQLPSNGPSLL